MSRIFLKAEWKNLVMANYIIDPKILSLYLPIRTELDFFKERTYVSLVGFMFQNTKVLGCKIPWHINFEEVNLRFYVRFKENNKWKRGVVFIKEIIPKIAITFIANNFYGEKYSAMRMKHYHREDTNGLLTGYEWKFKRWNKIEVLTDKKLIEMVEGSEEEFIAEHYFGYSRFNPHTSFEYEVKHPRWNIYPVTNYLIDCDFGGIYGNAFSFLENRKPDSVLMVDGSEITVSHKRTL